MGFNKKMGKFAITLLALQLVMLIVFGVMVEYEEHANASSEINQRDVKNGGADPDVNPVKPLYPMFQDVHVMIFIGFGFLMTFLRRYGYSAVGFNLLIAGFVLQWAMLMGGFMHLNENNKITIDIHSLLTADFAAAAVLISFGAVLGKTSPLQLLCMAVIEIIIFTVNEWVGIHIFKVADIGGSMFVHAFGAYFGLAVARVLYREDTENGKEGSTYTSDLFSMIGTIFLWVYWPSFNAALAPGDDQHRAIINTYLAIASSCCCAFAVSALISEDNKLDIVHIQNATLAGGVAVGTSADMMINPWGALLIGSVAGALSAIGYRYITPFLCEKLKIHDTCGVNNLHGMPGVLAGVAGAVAAGVASVQTYGNSLYQIFPARAPMNETDLAVITDVFGYVDHTGDGRTAAIQAGFQLAALGCTLLVAIVSGLIVGFLLRLPFFDQPKGSMIFDDSAWWGTPEDFTAEGKAMSGASKPEKLLEAGAPAAECAL